MKAIIFDFNGTLLWDTQLHNKAWDIFLDKYGIQMSDDEKNHRIHGRLNREILKDVFEEALTAERIAMLADEKELIYQELLLEIDLKLADGVIELFDELKRRNIPMAIATASGKLNVDFYIKTYNLHRWFDSLHIIYNDGSMRGKPYPDIFDKAISILEVRPEEAIILEDSMAGIKAAEAAGAGKIVIVNSSNGNYGTYVDKHEIVESYDELTLIDLVEGRI